MSVLDEFLDEARALQEALMTATGVVQRKTGETEYNPVTHQNEPVVQTVLTSKCRVQPARVATAELVQMFGQQINSLNVVGALPVAVTDLLAGDILQITASPDPGQVGKQYTLLAVHTSTSATARHFIAVDDQG